MEGSVLVSDLSRSESDSTSLGKTVDKYIESKAKSRKGYAARPGTRETINISGHTAERYVADQKNMLTGQDMTEWVLILLTQGKRYLFSFQADKDSFESAMSDFDPIIRTIRVE